MVSMSATEARNNIKRLWETAAQEPVTIESAGKPIAVVMSPEQYANATKEPARKPRQAGTMKHLFEGIDIDEFLATPIDDLFADYM